MPTKYTKTVTLTRTDVADILFNGLGLGSIEVTDFCDKRRR